MKPRIISARGWALALGAGGCAVGAFVDARTFVAAYLPVAVTMIALMSGALGVLMLSYLVRRSWTETMHPPLMAAALTLPFAGLLLVPIFAALPWLYPWATEAAHASFKDIFLSPWLFVLRSVGYIAVWTLLALWMRRAFGDVAAMQRAASAGMIVFSLTGSFAGIDWLESVNPEFHSSIYPFVFLTFQFVAGLAFGLFALLLRSSPPRHELSGYAAVMISALLLWAYNHAMQYIIVWSGNIPDETVWYLKRSEGAWEFVLWGLVALQFLAPFFALLSEAIRTSRAALLAIAAGTILLRFIEASLLVLPDMQGGGAILLLDIASLALLVVALWAFAFAYAEARVFVSATPAQAQPVPR